MNVCIYIPIMKPICSLCRYIYMYSREHVILWILRYQRAQLSTLVECPKRHKNPKIGQFKSKMKFRREFEVSQTYWLFAARIALWRVPIGVLWPEKLSDRTKFAFWTLLEVTNSTNTINIMYWGYILMVLSKKTWIFWRSKFWPY